MSTPSSVVRENPFQDGPYLLAAVLCERVLEEKDGVKSLIRITDRITITAAGKDVPSELPPFDYKAALFLSFKPGHRPGKYNLKIDLLKPSGEREPGPVLSLDLNTPPGTGKEVIVKMGAHIEREGIYWFEISLNDLIVTRVPFQVIYLIQTKGRAGSDSSRPVM